MLNRLKTPTEGQCHKNCLPSRPFFISQNSSGPLRFRRGTHIESLKILTWEGDIDSAQWSPIQMYTLDLLIPDT